MFLRNYKKRTKTLISFASALFIFSMLSSVIFPVGVVYANENSESHEIDTSESHDDDNEYHDNNNDENNDNDNNLPEEGSCTTDQTATGSVDGANAILNIPTGACPMEISFSSYSHQGTIIPLEDQILTDNVTSIYSPGTYNLGPLTLACNWQTDLYEGEVQTQLNPGGHSNLIASDYVENQDCNPIHVNTPPTITLVGTNPLIFNINDTFVDPGATAIDTEDGDLTSSIVVTGSVDTSIVGTTTLTYSVTDSGGLSASTTRQVIINGVSTTTPPVTPPTNPPTSGGGGGGGGGGSSSGGGTLGGHRHPIVVGEILGATSCYYLRDYLKIDWQNDKIEVLKLQSFLNVFEKESLSLTGVYNQTTFDAVSRFQTKYSEDILIPWGDKVTKGFVYILTKKKVNEIYCNSQFPVTLAQQNEIDAFKAAGNQNLSLGGVNLKTANTSATNPTASSSNDSIDSVIKNIAVSLFALSPKVLADKFNNYSNTSILLLLILIALIIIIIKLFVGSNGSNKPPITPPANMNSGKELPKKSLTDKEPPVIILPSALPDEEIMIDNPEEEELTMTTPDLRDDI